MSLSRWKELAERKTKAGQAINELYDNITEEKIRSKTTDAAIAKTFRLDKLDQIAEQTKPRERRRRRFPAPRINPDQNIDYAPEVDPYEDMDVEGLLNLEDYIAPQAEKQIVKKPSLYQMDPSFWQIPDDDLPPPYEEIEPLAIEAPENEEENRILERFSLPNFKALRMELAKPEMNYQGKKNYFTDVFTDANKAIKSESVKKAHAKNAFGRNEIDTDQLDQVYSRVDETIFTIRKLKSEVDREYRELTGTKVKSKKLPKVKFQKIGSGVVFYNKPQELLQKLSLILAEMRAGNTSIKMRNMGQNILDTLLKNNYLDKSNYGKIVKKYFSI